MIDLALAWLLATASAPSCRLVPSSRQLLIDVLDKSHLTIKEQVWIQRKREAKALEKAEDDAFCKLWGPKWRSR
jgi:hypothetical protein